MGTVNGETGTNDGWGDTFLFARLRKQGSELGGFGTRPYGTKQAFPVVGADGNEIGTLAGIIVSLQTYGTPMMKIGIVSRSFGHCWFIAPPIRMYLTSFPLGHVPWQLRLHGFSGERQSPAN